MTPRFALFITAALAHCAPIVEPTIPPLPDRVDGVFAMVDVTVIPVSGPTRTHQTVVVAEGRIASVGPVATIALPAGATLLPVPAGSFLVPGLADMHTHILDRDELLLYLANGVTTIRNLHGLGRHLAWRDSLERGLMDGPRLLTSGPILDGNPPSRSTNTVLRTEPEAEAAVDDQANRGFDYIKIYDNLPLDLYRAIGRAAARRGIPVTGHLPTPVGLDGLFANRVQNEVQHLEEFLPFVDDGRDIRLVDSIARGLARAGIAVVPTITVYTSGLAQAENLAALRQRPEMAFVNPATAATWGWTETAAGRSGQPGALTRYRRVVGFFEGQLLPALKRAGVTIVAGTDAPIPMIVPGFSLHDELANYVASGFSPLEALATATTAAGRVFPPGHQLPGFGTITVGAPADLLVLSADPTPSIAALKQRLGVVARGRWYSQARLDRSLDSLAAVYRSR